MDFTCQICSDARVEDFLDYVPVVLILVHEDGCGLMDIQISKHFPDQGQSSGPKPGRYIAVSIKF